MNLKVDFFYFVYVFNLIRPVTSFLAYSMHKNHVVLRRIW